MIRSAPLMTRFAAATRQTTARALSTQTSQAVAKLQAVLENYRLEKYVGLSVSSVSCAPSFPSLNAFFSIFSLHSYTQEIPTRFKKDIVQAASQNAPQVNATGLQHVLHNIGAPNVLSATELQAMFREMGNEKGEISAQHLVQLL